MASNEKHKKGFISTFYKSSIGNHKQKSETTAVTNIVVSRSSWFTKKPKKKGHIGDLKSPKLPEGNAGVLVQARKSASEVEPSLASFTAFLRAGGNRSVGGGDGGCGGGEGGELDLVVQGRKSVSHVEQARKSVSHVEQARKSVSHIELARKSVSHVENTLALPPANFQVKVLVSDMPGFMQVHAFQCARKTYDSLDNFSSKHMAYNIKKEFDKVYGPAWHCIVGSSFGSFVTHSTGCFLYFSMEKLYILVFRTKVKRVSD